MKSVLVTLLLLYIAFCLVLFAMQRKFLYFPQPAGGLIGAAEIHFESDGEQLNGWVVNEGHPKALLYYGGNAERIEDNIPFFEAVLPDYTVYLIPYRGYGNSTGEPTEEGLYSDALHIFEQIKARHVLISLMGRSLGSGIATYVAANREVEKLILVTPFDSIESVAKTVYWMLPVSLLIKDKFQSLHRVKNITAKTYIFIAENDRVIPRASTERLIAQFTDQLVTITVIARADHNDISQYPEYVAGLKHALEQ
ncbi:lysophospholipase [Photobacterium sagamiensis]|uniref:alpha/beta hydrolase n=1 Tax=Photobacterium sagamiensis TaxID=2910241 RepID=UPI003D0C92FB